MLKTPIIARAQDTLGVFFLSGQQRNSL